MSGRRLERVLPARQFVVTGSRDQAVATVVAALVARGYRVEQPASENEVGSVIHLEYGNGALRTVFGSGFGFGLLPGRVGKLGKHGFSVVEAQPEADGATVITVSHLHGLNIGEVMVQGVDEALGALSTAGVLRSVAPAMSARDLPESSAGNPKNFRGLRRR